MCPTQEVFDRTWSEMQESEHWIESPEMRDYANHVLDKFKEHSSVFALRKIGVRRYQEGNNSGT